jgi:hypothetical protein
MNALEKIETVSCKDVAKALKTQPAIVKAMILNGTMPIGGVGCGSRGDRDRIIILKERWDKYIRGEL